MLRKLFAKSGEESEQIIGSISINQPTQESIVFQERPKICLFDLDKNTKNVLETSGYNCTASSLGSLVDVPNNKQKQYHLCLVNHSTPPNLHEYDIVIIDLARGEHIPYDENAHFRSESKTTSQYYFVCEYPQTVFDPRPIAGRIISSDIQEIQKRESIIIIFAGHNYSLTYQPVELTTDGLLKRDTYTITNYGFMPNIPYPRNKKGLETKVSNASGELGNILLKYNNEFVYEVIFDQPTRWNSQQEGRVKDKFFIPLIYNLSDEIVSYIHIHNKSIVFMFPQLENKSAFLLEFFQNYLTGLAPSLFPFSTRFLWLQNKEYQLPNEAELVALQNALTKEYEKKIADVQHQIKENWEKYHHLHNLLSKSGDELVKACQHYLGWLGFENIINCDETFPGLNEEDIQVILDDGLLIIEVKGIGGTSKDSECSQISKIKYRRAKERGRFDVFALYIVNHQRYLPPEERKNPPFSEQQIEDAKSDERGILTTYDLFKLYFAIEAGFITKQDARQALLNHGLVEFRPSNTVLIGQPTEIHFNGTVGIFILSGISVSLGDELFAQSKTGLFKVKIVSIRDQDLDVESASEGEIGIKFSEKITIDSKLWKPTTTSLVG